jgi:catechol 2,3-dioxygenase-like lactoylglutathione lyase family enzyme
MLGSICAVTMVVPDLAPMQAAYTAFLGMRVVARGAVSPEDASRWGTPAASGCAYVALMPETGEETCLRFIAAPDLPPAPAFVSFGWNATEITVRDTDALAARLEGSPFRMIGPPANLKGFEWIRAMQVLGPCGECLYLTDVRKDASLAQAKAEIGQVFIVVVGGPDIGALQAFYRSHFSNDVSDSVAIPIGVISNAHKLPADYLHSLALVTLPEGTRIELDQYPPQAAARATLPGHLPPGLAMVSFRVKNFPEHGLLAPPSASDMAPFVGARTACLRGGAGELIELVEEDVLF